MIDWVEVLNNEDGSRSRVPREWLKGQKFIDPDLFTEVEPDQKPYVKELFKPRKGKAPKTDETVDPEQSLAD